MIKREKELKFLISEDYNIPQSKERIEISQWYLNNGITKLTFQNDKLIISLPTFEYKLGLNNQEDLKTLIYILNEESPTIRFRKHNDDYIFTLKGKPNKDGPAEYETSISKQDYDELSIFKENEVSKSRYIVEIDSYKWEIDIFKGKLEGLKIAELEKKEEYSVFPPLTLPSFLTKDVSDDKRYTNLDLGKNGIPNDSLIQFSK